MIKTAITLAALCTVFAAGTEAANGADWKLYGSAKDRQHCFYDVQSVSFRTVGQPRVWTKCLSEREMNDGADDAMAKRAAEKIVAGYVPPIIARVNFPFDQIADVVLYEIVADVSPLEPTVRIYWDLNCSEKMIRALDISTRDRQLGSIKKWDYIAPETNADRLQKMVCD